MLTSLLLICLLLTFLLACLGTPRVWFESMLLICSRAALGMLLISSTFFLICLVLPLICRSLVLGMVLDSVSDMLSLSLGVLDPCP